MAGSSPPNVFKIEQSGKVTAVLKESGVQSHAYKLPSKIVVDSANNKYFSSYFAIFKLAATGDVSVHLDFGVDRPIKATTFYYLPEFEADDFENLYFVEWPRVDTLYRYSASNGLQRILGAEGDGTGEFECVKQGDAEHGFQVCTGYGNFVDRIVGIHIDDAQNVYAAGLRSHNVFKVTPTDVVSEVADFGELENFEFERLRDIALDSIGNLYLLHGKENGSGVSLFNYSPFAVEGQDDFSLKMPHSQIVHNASGVSSVLPSSYTFTSLSQDDDLPDLLAHLDTRTEAFSQLPWQDGTTTSIDSTDSLSQIIRTSLTFEGRLYVADMSTSIDSMDRTKWINSIAFSVDGKQSYFLNGLKIPLDVYYGHMSQSLMSWLYLGNDVINGGPRADILFGYEGHDILYGNGGNDLMDGSAGANIFYGGDGIDTVVYEKTYSDYMLSRNPVTGFVSVQAKTGLGSPYIDQVAPDTERLRFSDVEIDTASLSYWGELRSVQAMQEETEPVTVYRFFNTIDNAFFYTINPDERAVVLRNSGPNNRDQVDWPYVYQGSKFQSAHSYPGAVPLYRFYNTQTGHHFFTVNENERAYILRQVQEAGWPFVDEGVAFEVYASDPTPSAQGRERPVYRFYSNTLNRHVFTTSDTELQFFDASQDWINEGVGFYAEGLE